MHMVNGRGSINKNFTADLVHEGVYRGKVSIWFAGNDQKIRIVVWGKTDTTYAVHKQTMLGWDWLNNTIEGLGLAQQHY